MAVDDGYNLWARLSRKQRDYDILLGKYNMLNDRLTSCQKKLVDYEKLINQMMLERYDLCEYCKHYIVCRGKECDCYESGESELIASDGVVLGNYKWSCEEFDYGTCKKMVNTPCNGCDFEKGFVWNGRFPNDKEETE